MTGLLIVEMAAARALAPLHPAGRYLDTDMPEVGTTITLPKQAFLLANRFLGEV